MEIANLIMWMMLLGLSLIFVGGFVLWVYGTEKAPSTPEYDEPMGSIARRFYQLVRWFLLYGGVTVFAGIGLLVTSTALSLQF